MADNLVLVSFRLLQTIKSVHVCSALIKIQMDCGNDSKQDWINLYETLTLMKSALVAVPLWMTSGKRYATW